MAKILVTREKIIAELFKRGDLRFILYQHQLPVYDKIREVLASKDTTTNSYVIDCARQYGKSMTMFLIAVEECLRYPKRTIAYIGPLKSQVNEIVDGNTFSVIFKECPQELIPVHKDSAIVFHNGSRIRLAGTDGKNYNNLRGSSAHTVFLDEAGFLSDLDTGVIPVVIPMTKTNNGKIIFASTPPDTLDHPYYDILRDHDESGLITTFTIWDDKSLTEPQLQKIISQCKGTDTTLFKREYECQRIAESSMQVIPELGKDADVMIDIDTHNDPLFKFYKKYIVVDWGGTDMTAVVFAYYDYRKKIVIIEDQLQLEGKDISSARIATEIKALRDKLWLPEEQFTGTGISCIAYICDSNNKLIQNDMITRHNLPFISTTKANLVDQMVQKVRDWVYDERIKFKPDAKFTLGSASSAHWNKQRVAFARSKVYSHYDHCAALVYLIRNIDERTDPIPPLLNTNSQRQYIDVALQKKVQSQGVAAMFNKRN